VSSRNINYLKKLPEKNQFVGNCLLLAMKSIYGFSFNNFNSIY